MLTFRLVVFTAVFIDLTIIADIGNLTRNEELFLMIGRGPVLGEYVW